MALPLSVYRHVKLGANRPVAYSTLGPFVFALGRTGAAGEGEVRCKRYPPPIAMRLGARVTFISFSDLPAALAQPEEWSLGYAVE